MEALHLVAAVAVQLGQLFGVLDPVLDRYVPFHLYTMRQAIEEGFILDVLESYTTYKTYFELVENEKAEGDKLVEELKTRRLLLEYVDRHEFAIRRKAHIIVDHFTRKTAQKIGGQAKAMVAAGELGEIRLVQGEYPQDWLTTPLEKTGQKQAAWRTDPKRSGAGGSIGDIGTHTYQLMCDISGLAAGELAADLTTFVKGRRLDDNAHVMLRFKGGARGMLWASQVAPGNENGLKVRVYGTKGGLEWSQVDPNYLWYTPLGEPKQLITRGGAGSTAPAGRVTRVPPGHPEGYLEGFANIYGEVARAIKAARAGRKPDREVSFPGIADGVAGMAFIEACVRSSAKNGKWMKL